MRIYVSGPMSDHPDLNFPAFFAAARKLRAAGYDVVDPADRGVVPGWKWEDYLKVDLRDLLTCDGVALLENWRGSRGAELEVYVAQSVGMVCRRVDDWIET